MNTSKGGKSGLDECLKTPDLSKGGILLTIIAQLQTFDIVFRKLAANLYNHFAHTFLYHNQLFYHTFVIPLLEPHYHHQSELYLRPWFKIIFHQWSTRCARVWFQYYRTCLRTLGILKFKTLPINLLTFGVCDYPLWNYDDPFLSEIFIILKTFHEIKNFCALFGIAIFSDFTIWFFVYTSLRWIKWHHRQHVTMWEFRATANF